MAQFKITLDTVSKKFFIFFVLSTSLLSGCATTQHYATVIKLDRSTSETKIILMPLDVELSLLTTGGVLEPNAEWTKAASEHMTTAISQFQSRRGLELLNYERPAPSSLLYKDLIELERLHEAVGQAILFHQYSFPLPAKQGAFDWTLGATATQLKASTGADYALFIHIRDSYSSAGRVVAQLAAAALLGTALAGGQQFGFASLVDLNTGAVVWFNYLFSESGDLRTEEPTKKTVEKLLQGFPT